MNTNIKLIKTSDKRVTLSINTDDMYGLGLMAARACRDDNWVAPWSLHERTAKLGQDILACLNIDPRDKMVDKPSRR